MSDSQELEGLLLALHSQREHVLAAVHELSDEALRRPVLPSGWTCLGMVRHLTFDVERFWFRAVVAGEALDVASGDGGWQVGVDTPAAAVLEEYREESARADHSLLGRRMDAKPAWWPVDIFPDLPARDLRWTVLHVITETACHAGHLDAARELLDGRLHLVLA